jgi:hypothetical protein
MYDTSFDHRAAELPRSDRRVLWALRIVAVLAMLAAASAGAQLPGAPILQNVWATPGVVGALNVAGGGGTTVYAAALSWTPGVGRLQVSGGTGFASGAGVGTRGAYGVRLSAPFGGDASMLGFAAFAGIGGAPARTTTTVVSCTVVLPSCAVVTPVRATSGLIQFDSTTSTTIIPVGVSVGWRTAVGTSHGISVYGSPAFVYYTGGTSNTGLIRAAVGIDAGITSSLGLTGGIEFGGTRPQAIGGPSGIVYGAGVSYGFGRR